MDTNEFRLVTEEQMNAVYGVPASASLVKEADHLHEVYRPFIERAPFAVLATSGLNGLETSPRGDPAGHLVEVLDPNTLLMPDRRGNNRIDSLRNIISDPRISLLFLIPGIGETIRVKGRAEVMIDPDLLDRFALDGRKPRTVLRILVERVFFQCSRALLRSKLWDPGTHVDRTALPSPGAILSALSADEIDGARYDIELPDRLKSTLY